MTATQAARWQPSSAQSALVPTPPRRLGEEGEREVQARAHELARQMLAEPADRQLARRLGSLGSEAQQKSGAQMDLLKTRVGTLMNDLDGPGAKIPARPGLAAPDHGRAQPPRSRWRSRGAS